MAPRRASPRARSPQGEEPEHALQEVRADTTLLDLVKWNTPERLAQAGGAKVIADRLPEPGRGFRLGLDQDLALAPEQRSRAEALGKEAVIAVLDNSLRHYGLEGTGAGSLIESHIDGIRDSDSSLTVADMSEVAREVSEAIHEHATARLGPSDAPREAGRMPMECLTHLAWAIREAAPGASEAQRATLAQADAAVKDRVFRHDLTPARTKAFLAALEPGLRDAGLPELAGLASELRAGIPEAGGAALFTRLHDNPYGRAMESLLVAELVDNPPAATRACMQTLTAALAKIVSTQPAQEQQRLALKLQGLVRADGRPWAAGSPALRAFAQSEDPGTAAAALQALLSAPVESGFDCMVVPYVCVPIAIESDKNPHVQAWREGAEENYPLIVDAKATIEEDAEENLNRASTTAGITLHHQPAAVRIAQGLAAKRPVDDIRPDLERPSPEVLQALAHGIPYGSGVSGSTNIVLHFVDYLQRQGVDVDAKQALLGTLMFLTHDGGHSLHESMWVANQLDERLDLGLGLPGGDPARYVADYQAFFDSFAPEEGGEALKAAADKAWSGTLQHFREHSPYARGD